jgi:long-subunit fatty acid transport protein
MARNHFALTTSAEVALSAATAKTVLQLVSASGIITAVQEILISFDGTSNSAAPVNIEIARQTTAGTATARNPLKTKDTSTALQLTGQEDASAEPTKGDVLTVFHIHPQAGVVYSVPLPDGEYELASSGRLGIIVTAPAGVNCLATIKGEE